MASTRYRTFLKFSAQKGIKSIRFQDYLNSSKFEKLKAEKYKILLWNLVSLGCRVRPKKTVEKEDEF